MVALEGISFLKWLLDSFPEEGGSRCRTAASAGRLVFTVPGFPSGLPQRCCHFKECPKEASEYLLSYSRLWVQILPLLCPRSWRAAASQRGRCWAWWTCDKASSGVQPSEVHGWGSAARRAYLTWCHSAEATVRCLCNHRRGCTFTATLLVSGQPRAGSASGSASPEAGWSMCTTQGSLSCR